MAMDFDDPAHLNGTTVVGGDGEKLGSVDAVYYDNATDEPAWVAVRSGLFGTRVTLVPLRRADYADEELRVPFDKTQLRNAPHHDPGRDLSSSDEADLYRYYGIDYALSDDESVTTQEFPVRGIGDEYEADERRAERDAAGGDGARLRRRAATGAEGGAPEEPVAFDDADLQRRRSI
jgi:hypothetical protein